MIEKRIRFIGLLIGLIISGIMVVTFVAGIWERLEDRALDVRFIMRGEIPVTEGDEEEKVVVISIDEASIEQYGRWPWSRDYHARLVNTLTEAGAKVIVFDIILSEPDMVKITGDMELALATADSRRVIHCSFFEARKVLVAQKGIETRVIYHEPILPLKNSSWAVGFTNAYPDADGVLRDCALRIKHEGKEYYSINVLAAARFLDKDPAEIIDEIPQSATYPAIDLDTKIRRTMMMVNFYGPENSIASYSYHQILNEKIPLVFKQNWVKDKIVIVGSKITGAFDHYPMAFSKIYPGVEFHATIINNLINGNFIHKVSPFIILLFIIFGGVFCGIAVPRFSPWLGTALVVGIAAVYMFGTQWLFAHTLMYVQIIPPLFTLFASYVTILFYRFLIEEKEKRRIKRSFGQYVSRSVLEEILSNPNLAKLGGERRDITILFSDIRNFTTMSEGMTPEEVVDILNEYLTKMTDVVYRHGGTLDKFIGDAVMAFWSAPIIQEDHPRRAMMCALDMFVELKALQEKWRKEGRPVMDIGVGINTGDVVVGNMGSHERMDYTVIGDNVNLASRLESLNKQYHAHIIISESTYSYVSELIEAKSLGGVKVKGKEKEVNIFQVFGRKNEEPVTA